MICQNENFPTAHQSIYEHSLRVDEVIVNQQVENFKVEIAKARNDIDGITPSSGESSTDGPTAAKRRRTDVETLRGACKEACDIMLVQATDRFSAIGNLMPLQ